MLRLRWAAAAPGLTLLALTLAAGPAAAQRGDAAEARSEGAPTPFAGAPIPQMGFAAGQWSLTPQLILVEHAGRVPDSDEGYTLRSLAIGGHASVALSERLALYGGMYGTTWPSDVDTRELGGRVRLQLLAGGGGFVYTFLDHGMFRASAAGGLTVFGMRADLSGGRLGARRDVEQHLFHSYGSAALGAAQLEFRPIPYLSVVPYVTAWRTVVAALRVGPLSERAELRDWHLNAGFDLWLYFGEDSAHLGLGFLRDFTAESAVNTITLSYTFSLLPDQPRSDPPAAPAAGERG